MFNHQLGGFGPVSYTGFAGLAFDGDDVGFRDGLGRLVGPHWLQVIFLLKISEFGERRPLQVYVFPEDLDFRFRLDTAEIQAPQYVREIRALVGCWSRFDVLRHY